MKRRKIGNIRRSKVKIEDQESRYEELESIPEKRTKRDSKQKRGGYYIKQRTPVQDSED